MGGLGRMGRSLCCAGAGSSAGRGGSDCLRLFASHGSSTSS